MHNALILQADVAKLPLADKSVDLVFGSPPYCDARTYGIGAQRDCVAWVRWMLDVTTESLRVSKGAVIWVANSKHDGKRNYWPACEGLMWLWYCRGGSMYRPLFWHRIGIPGSGQDQWFRADIEFIMCFKRPGSLPWANNTAMGHAPRWAPGGEMSHRISSGTRVNQWGKAGSPRGMGNKNADGVVDSGPRPSHVFGTGGHMPESRNGDAVRRKYPTRKNQDGIHGEKRVGAPRYDGVAIANPGNLIHTHVGGGHLGDDITHENEAPFPEKLAEFFLLSLCPPGGTVLDPFSGSGTTAKVALENSRKAVGSDIRFNQCELSMRRINRAEVKLFS